MSAMSGRHYQPFLNNSLAIRQEIQRFESVHPSIYAIYDLIELIPEAAVAQQIRDHVVCIEDSFVNSQEWTLSRGVPDLRLGIVGSLSSGKSALVHRYLTGSYMQEESPEGGRFKKEIMVDGISYLLLIRDEGGPPDLQFTSWVDAVIFVFSLENETSFNAIYNYYTKMAHYRNATDIPLILVGTQDAISENNPRVIDDSRARKLATDLKRCSYYETCATYGLNVERVFQDACQRIVQQRLSGQFSAQVPGTPTNSRPSTPNSHFSTMIPVGNLTFRHYSQPSPTNGPVNTSSSSGGSPSTNNIHGPGSPNHLSHKETISRQIHTFSASSHQLHRHPDIVSKSEVCSKAEEKRAGSYATLGPSHSHSLIESSNNVKLGPGQNLDNLAPLGKEKDLPTPSSTPTTSRKSRRRSNLFTSSKKEDDRVKNGELGSGRAIPLKQGLLYKRSSKSLNKEWKKKYVTLCEDGRLIYYPNLQDYMNNIHGKEISLQYVTVKVPGQKPRGSRSIIPTNNGLNDGFSNLSLSSYLGKDKRFNEKALLSAFDPTKDSVLTSQTDEGISSISTALTNGTDHRIETPNVKKRHRRMKSSGIKNADCDDPGGYEFFIVSLNNKQWHFEASNSEERDDWVSAIEQQILNSLQGNEISKSRSRFTMVDTTSLIAIKNKVPGNSQCVDCDALKPSWASINLGVLMCIECSGIHRNLGSHISRVRSLDLDEWPPGPLSIMLVTGNAMANSIWECNTGGQNKPNPSSCGEEKERWIKAKYENKEFLANLTSSQSIDQQLVDAVCRADIKAVMLILAHATPNDVNCTVSARDLRTPLHLASAMGNLSIAQLLIWNGANPRVLDQEGRSCLSYAMTASCKTSTDSTSLINLLTDAGAVPESGSGRRDSGGRVDLPSFNKRQKRSIDIISSLEHISDVRLPRDVTPLAYNLELQPFIEEGEFQGHVTINITCLEDTDKIILHAHQDLEISDGDVSVSLLSSSTVSQEEEAQNKKSALFTTPTTNIKTSTAYPSLIISTESNVTSVPPRDTSTPPTDDNCGCHMVFTKSLVGKESENPDVREMLPKAESLMSNKPTDSHIHRAATETAPAAAAAENVTEASHKAGYVPFIPPNASQLVSLTVTQTERQLSKQRYIIYVSEGLKRGENYQLDLKFGGSLLTNSKDGFFVETYVNKQTGEKRQYVATQMRPNHARRVFPCFDEPSYKVPFEIRVARNPSAVAISNMPLAHTEQSPTEKEWVWDHFQSTLPMSTFSLAVLISDLEQVEKSNTRENEDEIERVTVWGRKSILSSLKSPARIATKVIKELEMFFGMPLPVPKLDLVALPGYTAIPDSNWGVIFFKESDLLTDEHLVKHIAREVVYQWIGNLITPHWWTDVHINKALCNFIACIISSKVDDSIIPNSALWTKNYPLYYEYGRNQPYKQLPSQKPPKTVTKSELILRMFNYTLSESTFQKAIQQLLGERQYKTFTQDDIWSALTEQAGMDGTLPEPATINQIADSWIKKERLPLVTVIRNYEKNTAECEQSVFVRDHLEENSTNVEENLTWMIPLVVVFQNSLNFTSFKPLVWMKEEKKVTISNLPSSSFFVIINPEEIGPFIVNYDLHNWALISEFLEKYGNNKQIPPATRAKLIHDSLNLAYAGNLRFDVALNVTRFLYKEKDPIVWQAAFNMFDHILRHLEGYETGKKFQEYIKFILSNVYSYLEKLESKLTKSQERMYKSAKSALCNAGYPPCVKEARMQFKKWMEFSDPDAGIPISQSHFCWVFKWGTKEEWEFGLERYLKYPSHLKQSDRYYLLKTLVSCPTNAWNVEKVLNMTMLDPNSTITDGNARFILSILSNQAGYTALFNLLADNWDALRNRFDNKESGLWDNLVSAATRNFKDQDGLDMVSELYVERQGEFGSAEAVIEQSLKHIRKEVKWNEENLSVIDQWLNEFFSSTRSAS